MAAKSAGRLVALVLTEISRAVAHPILVVSAASEGSAGSRPTAPAASGTGEGVGPGGR